MNIRFGTDGWRAKMGRDFTFANVRRVCQAYANFLKKSCKTKEIGILVNHDTRYLSAEFASEAAKILSLNRIRVFLPDRDAPVPAASLAIARHQLQGGITFTASYNELIFNGFKLSDGRGIPLLPSKTVLVEEEIERLGPKFFFDSRYADERLLVPIEIKTPYLEYISGIVDFPKIRQAGQRIVVDCLYGTSRDYLDKLFIDHGIPITAIHNYSDAHFGGVVPSCSRSNLGELAQLVVEKEAQVGLATDIDGDRFGIVDHKGRFLDANRVMPPLVEYLITVRKFSGDIVKSISTTQLINDVAEYYLRRVYETPVGFKYLADMLATRKAFIGVESSNGAALKGQAAGKDGILFNLLVAEMMAHYRCPLQKILDDFHRRFPRLHSMEVKLRRIPSRAAAFQKAIGRKGSFGFSRPPRQIVRLDGIKFLFNRSWLLIRESGTSPFFKVYAESPSLSETRTLMSWGKKLLEQE